jgi:hypothetical protein
MERAAANKGSAPIFGNGWIKVVDLPNAELHTGPVTFTRAPYTRDLAGANAAVLGMPFDCGFHPFRIGPQYAAN